MAWKTDIKTASLRSKPTVYTGTAKRNPPLSRRAERSLSAVNRQQSAGVRKTCPEPRARSRVRSDVPALGNHGPSLNDTILKERADFASRKTTELARLATAQCDLKHAIETLAIRPTDANPSPSPSPSSSTFLDLQKHIGLMRELEQVERRMENLHTDQDMDKFDRLVQPHLQAYTHEYETHQMECNAPRRRRIDVADLRHLPPYAAFTTQKRPRAPDPTDASRGRNLNTALHETRLDTIVAECLSEVRLDHSPPVLQSNESHCPTCKLPFILVTALAAMVCQRCGMKQRHMDTTITSAFGRETDNGFHYKRINHLNESLLLFQAKESTIVPPEVIHKTMTQLYTLGHVDISKINRCNVRETLRDLGQRKYYENESQITFLITGKIPPQMTSAEEERMRMRFLAIQTPFRKHCPSARKNFFSYPYVLYKFCEIENWPQFLPCFRLHKGADKRKYLDLIWKKICRELDGVDPTMPWPYYEMPPPTTARTVQSYW
jgi:hypothetical protein